MKITSPKLSTSHRSANEEALRKCESALGRKDKGDYEGALDVMGPLWSRVGERPQTKDLHPSVTAEVLLCVGVLTRWIGSRNQIKESQTIARDLISESINFYESVGDIKKIASARVELAYCYWREGALDEARIMFNEALQKLTTEGNTRANALLGLAVVEWSASRYRVGLKILDDNSTLFAKITNHTIKGAYHNQLAIMLRNLASSRNGADYFQEAIIHYREADNHFKLAHNVSFRADVQNNLGYLLYKLSHFKKSHEHLDQARRLTSRIKDKIGVAQIDDTRAQVLITERRFREAESVTRGAVRVLEKSGHECLLAEVLTTYGIALARLGKKDQAQFTLQRAIEVARQVGALNKAGLAALSLIEELDGLPRNTLQVAFHSAREWLANAQSQELEGRFAAAADKVFAILNGELTEEAATETLLNKSCDLQKEMLKHEGTMIKQALVNGNGSLTRAASLLTMSYQALSYMIEARHKELLKERTPIRRRSSKKETQKKRSVED